MSQSTTETDSGWIEATLLGESSQDGPDIELRDEAEQRPLCLLLSGTVDPITHQYSRCLFFPLPSSPLNLIRESADAVCTRLM